MSTGSNFPGPADASRVPKRPVGDSKESEKDVGLSGLPLAQAQQGNGPGQAAERDPRPRPVFKMRRTGHSGPFPLSGRPTLQVRVLLDGKNPSPSPSASSAAPSPGASATAPKAAHDTTRAQLGTASPLERDPSGPASDTVSTPPDSGVERIPNPGKESSVVENPTPAFNKGILQSGAGLRIGAARSTSTEELGRPAPDPESGTLSWGSVSAIDPQSYKQWTDESGTVLPTAGALLPQGYRKSDDPSLPWLCPVRSCRLMFSSLQGLGSHFSNAHRAARFNDNLDGTLTDLGSYSDPAAHDGVRKAGSAKPALIVSKKAMSLAESPILEARTAVSKRSATIVPPRGGPGRLSTIGQVVPEAAINSNELVPARGLIADDRQPAPLSGGADQALTMANPDRRYNEWPDPSGQLTDTLGVLLPDGYALDTTMPGRPWICPIRSCRRLFMSLQSLGHHFKRGHRSSRLNDNLDGTLSILETNDNITYPVIVARNPMDLEELAEPSYPTYPHPSGKLILWVNARTKVQSPIAPVGRPAEESPDPDSADSVQDLGILTAPDGRPYREWFRNGLDKSDGFASMGGALIPDGYHLDYKIPDRPWVCPVRSCRAACKIKQSLAQHFTKAHPSDDLNDNCDGTFSIVGSNSQQAARVVSRKPMAPEGGPLAEPRLPPGRVYARMAASPRLSSSPAGASVTGNAQPVSQPSLPLPGQPGDMWSHICSSLGFDMPEPDNPELKILLSQPRVRDLTPGEALGPDLNPKQVAGLLIQVTGEEASRACSACRRGTGPFPPCVQAPINVAWQVIPLLMTASRACGNCLVLKKSHACSKKSAPELLPARDKDDTLSPDTAVTPSPDAGLERRRSVRLTLTSAEPHDAEDEMSAAEEPEPRRRAAVSRAGRGATTNGNGQRPGVRQPPGAVRIPGPVVPESELQLEDWEMDHGRVTGVGETLAVSTSYLVANQTVQVSPNVTFQATTIASGRAHHFAAEPAKTRVCTLLGGKLRVQVGGEPEFVIGAGGMFKIAAGVACSATNRCYLDVVLHVTCANER